MNDGPDHGDVRLWREETRGLAPQISIMPPSGYALKLRSHRPSGNLCHPGRMTHTDVTYRFWVGGPQAQPRSATSGRPASFKCLLESTSRREDVLRRTEDLGWRATRAALGGVSSGGGGVRHCTG